MAEQNSFEFEIIRPRSIEKLNVEWLEIQSPTGDFVVGPGHSPVVSVLKERSKLIFKKIGALKPDSFDVYGGVFRCVANKAVAILDL